MLINVQPRLDDMSAIDMQKEKIKTVNEPEYPCAVPYFASAQ